MQIPNFYVITGGPGSGKTTVLAELIRLGHYTTDSERRQSREEAERTEHAVAQTYTELGYRIVRLPLINPAERAEFILRHSIQT
jgi:predicted ATPase